MELAAGYHPTSSQPTNGWISSPRTSFLSTPRTQTPTGRILSSKTCVRILMQMAGSVCSCSAQNCHFLHLHLYLTNVLKRSILTDNSLEHINDILVPSEHKSNHLMSHHIVFLQNVLWWRHFLWQARHIITGQHGARVGQHQTVTQHLWGHLHLQGWGGPGGGILGSDGVDLLFKLSSTVLN